MALRSAQDPKEQALQVQEGFSAGCSEGVVLQQWVAASQQLQAHPRWLLERHAKVVGLDGRKQLHH
jgi:hypothetical protein